jgi:hypothetical protein
MGSPHPFLHTLHNEGLENVWIIETCEADFNVEVAKDGV